MKHVDPRQLRPGTRREERRALERAAERAGKTPEEIEQAVAAAGRTRLDGRDPAAADLSPAAIAARRTGDSLTGLQLVYRAAAVLQEANRLRRVANARSGRRAASASGRADDALRTAAVQIRLAQLVPLARGYLHTLALDRVQTVKEEVGRAFDRDPGALAVDTHRRIQDQRARIRAEGAS